MTLLIQVLIVFIIFGVVYSLWKTTMAYGGLIGAALKWIGIGMLFFSLEAADRALGNLSFINSLASADNAYFLHSIILLLGLLFSAIGFSRLTRAAK